VSQINFSYGLATKGAQQAHMHLLGAHGYVKQQLLAQLPHLDSWAVTVADETYTEHFKVGGPHPDTPAAARRGWRAWLPSGPGSSKQDAMRARPTARAATQPGAVALRRPIHLQDCLQDVVYLTADSPNELDTIDTSKVRSEIFRWCHTASAAGSYRHQHALLACTLASTCHLSLRLVHPLTRAPVSPQVYIIGGIVDRNRHKRICLSRAEAANVAHARLPIQKHVQLSTSAVGNAHGPGSCWATRPDIASPRPPLLRRQQQAWLAGRHQRAHAPGTGWRALLMRASDHLLTAGPPFCNPRDR
jgi:hypothetical protein